MVFHGWRIVAVLAATETVSWGVLYYAFAVFVVPMQAELGFSRATLTGAYSVALLVAGAAAVPVGRWVDRHGARALMTTGSFGAALLVVAWSRVHSVAGLYAVFAGIGVVSAAVLYEPAFAVVVRWFDRRRATALLAITVAGGLASTIFVPLANALLEAYGWRQALLVLAGVLAATTVLPHALVLPCPAHPERPAVDAPDIDAPDIDARVDPAFRWLVLAFTTNTAATVTVVVHLVPHLREVGHSGGFAAGAAGALGVLSVAGRLALTALTRRLPVAQVTAAVFLLQAAGTAVLLAAGGTSAGAVVFVALFGIGFGVATIARPLLLGARYGATRYGSVSGLLGVPVAVAKAAAPVLAGTAWSTTGSYLPVWVAVALASAAAAAALGAYARRTAPYLPRDTSSRRATTSARSA